VITHAQPTVDIILLKPGW